MKLTRKEYTTPEEKKKDFWLGFWLWWVANLVMLAVTGLGLSAVGYGLSRAGAHISLLVQIAGAVVGVVPLVVNIAALIFLGETRRQLAHGALWAFAIAAVTAVVMLPFAAVAACFVVASSQ